MRTLAKAALALAGLTLLCTLLTHGAWAHEGHDHSTECSCVKAKKTHDWCHAHEWGFVGGQKIHSQELFETLDAYGHEVDPEGFHCSACRRAYDEQGFCDEHRVGFVDGKGYFSRLTYLLHKWETRAVPTCPTHTEPTAGWNEACKAGQIGSMLVADRADYDQIRRELAKVQQADELAETCVHCASALISGTRCPICKKNPGD